MLRKFSCITGCSDCCIYRDYYPCIKYGKIGVLILPEEKTKIELQAKEMGLKVKILPRLGIGRNEKGDGPETVIAYQLMGKNNDGNVCPFLESESIEERSPHGGFKCKIYNNKPLACSAYPILAEDQQAVTLDNKCKFCRNTKSIKADKNNLRKEIHALKKIIQSINVDERTKVWRYATEIGQEENGRIELYPEGWILQEI